MRPETSLPSDALFGLCISFFHFLHLLSMSLLNALSIDNVYFFARIDCFTLTHSTDCISVVLLVVHVTFKVNVEIFLLFVTESVDVVETTWLQISKVLKLVISTFLGKESKFLCCTLDTSIFLHRHSLLWRARHSLSMGTIWREDLIQELFIL